MAVSIISHLSSLESLPFELQIVIFRPLGRADTSRVMRCSKFLRGLLHEKLWGNPYNHNHALHWACRAGMCPLSASSPPF